MKDMLLRFILAKFGNGTFVLVTTSKNSHYRVELWNKEQTRILFFFEGEI